MKIKMELIQIMILMITKVDEQLVDTNSENQSSENVIQKINTTI